MNTVTFQLTEPPAAAVELLFNQYEEMAEIGSIMAQLYKDGPVYKCKAKVINTEQATTMQRVLGVKVGTTTRT